MITLQNFSTNIFLMRFFYIATHIFLLLISSVACSRSDIADKLSRVEELSECDSDSALAIIDSIDPSTLGSESEKAKYALLLTAMKIDNGKVLGNDSLIDIAISYYSKHDATYDQMRALYYKGISNYMKGRLANAIVPATCSRELAIKTDNDYWRAKSTELLGAIFNYSQNKKEAINYFKEAADYYQKTGKTTEHRLALCYFAVAKSGKEPNPESIAMLDSLHALAKAAPSDSILMSYCYKELLPMYLSSNRNEDAAYALQELSSLKIRRISDAQKHAYTANLALNLGDTAKAAKELLTAESLARSATEKVLAYTNYINLYKAEGRFREALALTDSIIRAQNRGIATVMNLSVVGEQRDYFREKAEKEAFRSARLKAFILFGGVAVMLLVAFLIYRHKMKMKVKKAEIDSRMNDILRLTESIEKEKRKKDNEISSLTESLNETIERQKSEIRELGEIAARKETERVPPVADVRIESLFKEQWRFLNMLCNDYFEKGDSPKARTGIIHSIEKEIEKLRKPSNLRDIEKAVDECQGGVVSRLRTQCPFLKETDIVFISLIYAGLSPKAVCIFTDIKIKYYYNKKKRLTDRIEASDAPDKDLFISKMA